MSIPFLIVVAYIGLLFAIGFYAKKKASGSAVDYQRAGNQLSFPLVMVSIVGLAVGGASTIGVSEQAFRIGLSAGWYTVAWAIGAAFMGVVMIKKLRSLPDFTTLPELLARRYDQKGYVASIVTQMMIGVVSTSLQYIAGGSILHTLLPEYFSFEGGVLVSGVVFVGLTFIGGLWSASLSNILNVALIYFGLIVAAIVCIFNQGGLTSVAAKLPATGHWFDFVSGFGWTGIFAMITIFISFNIGVQSVTQIAMSANSTKSACRGFIVGAMVMLPIGFVSALLGVVAKSMYPDSTATLALPQAIMSLNPWLAGVTLAALWAADVSTACNLLLGTSTLVSQDIYKRFINPNVTPKQYLWVNRASVAILGVLTCGMALTIKGIISTLMIGLSLCAAYGVTLLFALFAPSFCRKSSAFWTFSSAILLMILWQTVPAIRLVPQLIYAEWIVCTLVFLTVALVTPQEVTTSKLVESEGAP